MASVSLRAGCLAVSLALAGAGGLGAQDRPGAADGCSQTSDAVAAALRYLIDRDNARDLTGVLGGYTEDVVWLPPDGGEQVGKAAIAPRYEAMFRGGVALETEIVEAVAAGEHGFARGATRGALIGEDGTVTPVDGRFLAVTRCEAGAWRVARLAWGDRGSASGAAPPAADEPPRDRPCARQARYRELEFWLGEWDVQVEGESVGSNLIEQALAGCAVLEHWRDRDGGAGMSLFYVDLRSGDWKQVWVTDGGGMKEKRLVERFPNGGLRFQGTVRRASGADVLDRTTLTPLDGGRVRQVIEQSTDAGAHWRVLFDALYLPLPAKAAPTR